LKRLSVLFERDIVKSFDRDIDAVIAIDKTQALEQGMTSLIVISGGRTRGSKGLLFCSHASPRTYSIVLTQNGVHALRRRSRGECDDWRVMQKMMHHDASRERIVLRKTRKSDHLESH